MKFVEFEDKIYPQGELTEPMELYAQLRAQGRTKTDACKKAYPDGKYPGQQGALLEKDPRIATRIAQLKEERAEVFLLDQVEQVRKYHEMYMRAMDEGKLSVAMKALERIDAIGGFEVKKSEMVKINKGEALLSKDGDLKKDLERFKEVLGTKEEPKETLQ
jgi:hypothetical protein